MRIQDIYHNHRQRPGPEFVTQLKHKLLEIATETSSKDGFHGVFAVPFGEKNYPFPPTGDVAKYPCVFPEVKKTLIEAGVFPEPGELPVARHLDGLDCPAGVVLVTGSGNSGKTPFAYALADAVCKDDPQGFGLLRYGEPFAGYLKTEQEAGSELAMLMAGHRAVVVDSVKDLLTDMSGQATESGIARKAISMMSRLSMLASEIGCCVIVPINPSSVKTTVKDLMNEVARSNVAMAAINDNDKWAMLSRTGEGRMRVEAAASLKFTDGLPSITFRGGGSAASEVANVVAAFEAAAQPDSITFLSAARRIANREN